MDFGRLALAIMGCAALLASGCFESAPAVPTPTPTPSNGIIQILSGDGAKILTNVVSFDGHRIPITVYRPIEATPATPVPVLLHSHGWSGQRIVADNAFRDYHRAGFGVVTIDMRGHGEARATSTARVHHIEYEIKDVREVITAVAKLDWVRMERPDDPLVGALGGSYGGGYQLLAAATDPRLDAIAPEITWNSVLQSLAPNGAVKSAWVDILYGSGSINARLDPSIHQGFSIAQAENRIPDGSAPGEYDLKTQFTRSSPASYPLAIRIPTFLIQGVNDTLFNLNEAIANLEMIEANGADVRLMTHLAGHILNTRGTIPVPAPQPVGLQTPTAGSPCGSIRNQTIAWYQTTLLGRDVDLGPRVCLALEDSTWIRGATYPPPYAENRTFALAGPAQLTAPQASAVVLPILTAPDGGAVLAGIPTLSGNVTSTGDAILYYSLVATRGETTRTLNAQITPQRISGSLIGFQLDLGGIGARLLGGERLQLQISTTSDQYAHNSGRSPSTALASDLRIEIPIVASGP